MGSAIKASQSFSARTCGVKVMARLLWFQLWTSNILTRQQSRSRPWRDTFLSSLTRMAMIAPTRRRRSNGKRIRRLLLNVSHNPMQTRHGYRGMSDTPVAIPLFGPQHCATTLSPVSGILQPSDRLRWGYATCLPNCGKERLDEDLSSIGWWKTGCGITFIMRCPTEV